MARFSHKDAYIEFATVDLSGRSNTCTLSIEVDAQDVTCFSEAWDEFVEGGGRWSIEVAGFTDQDAGQVEDTLFAAKGSGAQAVDYRPQGETSGYKFTGNAIMTAFSVGGDRTGGCPYSASLQGTGTLSRTAVT